MLDNIKSYYFIKLIFLHLEEEIKLEIIRYNKNLQDKLDIGFINYKTFSDNYIIFESENKIKEYNDKNDKLIYKGNFSKGNKNGKGKEFDYKGNLIFEGDYFNGKRWNGKIFFENKIYEIKNGKGTIQEYNSFNNNIFEGEYLYGKRNGKGKEYNPFGKLIFEGEYLNGKKWNGKAHFLNKTYEIKNGKGFIKEYDYYDDEIIFSGEYLNGRKNGKGKEYNSTDKFEGEYSNGKKNGKGKKYNTKDNKLLFDGEYLNGKKWNGQVYFKDEINVLKNGKGFIKEYNRHTENIYEGNYLYGRENGEGKEYKYNKLIYEGRFLNGKRSGIGKEYTYLNGGLTYDGEYLYGKRNGKGKEYNSVNGQLKFEGEYLNGEKHGKGKEYKNGQVIFEGEYLNGKKIILK